MDTTPACEYCGAPHAIRNFNTDINAFGTRITDILVDPKQYTYRSCHQVTTPISDVNPFEYDFTLFHGNFYRIQDNYRKSYRHR